MRSLHTANERLTRDFKQKHKPITSEEVTAIFSRKDILSVSADAKTVKGETKGYLTGILYLSPSNIYTDHNLCPFASDACRSACLFTAGRGRFYSVTRARVVKTLAFLNDPASFMRVVAASIERLEKKARKAGLLPVVRLNGTSDIDWARYNNKGGLFAKSIFDQFPNVQFYDYTKNIRIATRNNPANYHITFSDSGVNEADVLRAIIAKINIATVFGKTLPDTFRDLPVIDGDTSDLRFLDATGYIVGLKAKGAAKKQDTTFIRGNQ